jgi:nucleotide-binding universal stress UspA family protein
MAKSISIRNILYTTDLSDTALHAFSYAVNLANLYGASITILHVIEDQDAVEAQLAGMLMQDQWAAIKARHIEEARESLTGKNRSNIVVKEALAQYAENIKSGGEAHQFTTDEVLVLFGDPVEKIVEASRERKCDLIVMGSHGHGILQDILGSTSRKVLRQSRIPVLIIPLDK